VGAPFLKHDLFCFEDFRYSFHFDLQKSGIYLKKYKRLGINFVLSQFRRNN